MTSRASDAEFPNRDRQHRENEYVNAVEMAQIVSDKRLMAKLRAGRRDAAKRAWKFVPMTAADHRSRAY